MSAPARYRVWDAPTRVVHWLLVLGFAFQYLSGELGLASMDWHAYVGYALLALLLFRIAWGFAGSDSARFARFVQGPRAAYAYARDVRAAGRFPGHNPLGGLSTLVLLALLLLQAISGLYTSDDVLAAGPLADGASAAVVEAMGSIHRINQKILLGFVALHVIAVAWHALVPREDLVRAMFDGRKTLDADPALDFASWTRAALLFAGAAALVYAVVEYG